MALFIVSCFTPPVVHPISFLKSSNMHPRWEYPDANFLENAFVLCSSPEPITTLSSVTSCLSSSTARTTIIVSTRFYLWLFLLPSLYTWCVPSVVECRNKRTTTPKVLCKWTTFRIFAYLIPCFDPIHDTMCSTLSSCLLFFLFCFSCNVIFPNNQVYLLNHYFPLADLNFYTFSIRCQNPPRYLKI